MNSSNTIFKTAPLKHQLLLHNLLDGKKEFALLGEQGTGKTWNLINDMARLWASKEIDCALVIAPNGVHLNWHYDELPKHMPAWCNWTSQYWTAADTIKNRRRMARVLDPDDGQLRIFLTSWDSLTSQRAMKFLLKFCTNCMRLYVVADESHRAKNPRSIRAKGLMKFKSHSLYRRIATGTPILHSPFDAFSQFSFLNECILGTTSYASFKSEHAEMLSADSGLVRHIMARQTGHRKYVPQIVDKDETGRPKYRNLDSLAKTIAPYSHRVLKKDCLDLPEQIYKTIYFELEREQQAIYDKMTDEAQLVLNGATTVFQKIATLNKLSQITSGFVIKEGEVHAIADPNPKLAALMEAMEDLREEESSTIVWTRFLYESTMISEAFDKQGIDFSVITGSTPIAERKRIINDFQSGKVRNIIAQVQVLSTGFTLTAGDANIYFDNTSQLEHRLQSEARTHRYGRVQPVVYIDLIAIGTIDETIVQANQAKQDIAAMIQGDKILLKIQHEID